MDGLTGFVVAAFALVGSPGPNSLSLAAAGAAFGVRASLAFFSGILVGMVIVIAITASGVTGLLLAIPGAAPVLVTAAATYIAYLAYRIATAPPLAEQSNHDRRPSFVGGVLLSLSNPKAYAAMAALFSGFILVGGNLALDAAFKAAAIVTVIILANVTWLHIGAVLTRFARQPRISRAINVTFAVLLVVSVAYALL